MGTRQPLPQDYDPAKDPMEYKIGDGIHQEFPEEHTREERPALRKLRFIINSSLDVGELYWALESGEDVLVPEEFYKRDIETKTRLETNWTRLTAREGRKGRIFKRDKLEIEGIKYFHFHEVK